jgi:hypothetical protein
MDKNTPVYWTMRDGKKINVDDMDINHLRNTLKLIIRLNQNKKHIIDGIMSNFEEDMVNDIEDDYFKEDPYEWQ